jgi:5-oxoprolinase (ATP-hydrolysing) subunit A
MGYSHIEMLINADIGEMTGADEEIMPCISVGNIACGYHVSNPEHMAETVRLALSYGVRISAHPSYFDRENFGRISIQHTAEEIVDLLEVQVSLLEKICVAYGVSLFAIKPHGALYHDMMGKQHVREAIVSVARKYGLPLIVQAMPSSGKEIEWGIPVLTEVFADRAYLPDGRLKPRSEAGSLYLEESVIVHQAREFLENSSADTLCFHGDNPASVAALKCLYAED